MHGCEQWINTHSKVGVNKIVSRFEMTDQPVKLKREYWVALDYREKARGPLMQGSSHYVGIVGNVVLLEARSVIKHQGKTPLVGYHDPLSLNAVSSDRLLGVRNEGEMHDKIFLLNTKISLAFLFGLY